MPISPEYHNPAQDYRDGWPQVTYRYTEGPRKGTLTIVCDGMEVDYVPEPRPGAPSPDMPFAQIDNGAEAIKNCIRAMSTDERISIGTLLNFINHLHKIQSAFMGRD